MTEVTRKIFYQYLNDNKDKLKQTYDSCHTDIWSDENGNEKAHSHVDNGYETYLVDEAYPDISTIQVLTSYINKFG
jgi:hypothetical protein